MSSNNPLEAPAPRSMDLLDHYPLGARVFAIRACGVCEAGEAGLVVEAYELGGRPGRTILFERGEYDGFSPDDLAMITLPLGSVDPKAAAYRFAGVGRLSDDMRRGAFDFAAFPPYAEWLAAKEGSDLALACAPAGRKAGPGRM